MLWIQGERPYACEICGKSYGARATYVDHYRRVHEKKKPKPRAAAPKQPRRPTKYFVFPKALVSKALMVIFPYRDRRNNAVVYHCEFCQRGFTRLLPYEQHRSTHTGVEGILHVSVTNKNSLTKYIYFFSLCSLYGDRLRLHLFDHEATKGAITLKVIAFSRDFYV